MKNRGAIPLMVGVMGMVSGVMSIGAWVILAQEQIIPSSGSINTVLLTAVAALLSAMTTGFGFLGKKFLDGTIVHTDVDETRDLLREATEAIVMYDKWIAKNVMGKGSDGI